MRLPTLVACLSATVSLYAVACRSDNNNTPTDGQGSNNGSGNFVTIQQVQDDTMAPGTAVNLHDVVVTAIDSYGTKTGDIWVEEKGGGKRSGVHVFGAVPSDVAMLSIGDEIDLKGAIKSEFALTGSNADSTGRTETELEKASGGQITITKLGMSTTITPDKVDALAIGKMYDPSMAATGGGTAFTNAWEDWEGVLVELDNVDALNASACVGSACSDPTLKKFGITGIATAESSLAAFADDANIKRGYCFGNITGVISYFYDYLIYPRSAADMSGNGGSCPPAEQANGTDGSVCTDGVDNDGNGFADCKDLGCEAGASAWLGADSCSNAADTTCGCSKAYAAGSAGSINTDFATTAGAVYLRNVYVTGINTASRGYFVSDSLTQQAGHGMFVFTSSTPDASITVGSQLAYVQGVAGPYPATGTGVKVVEVTNPTSGAVSAGGTIVPITGVAIDAVAAAPYYGTLVKVGPVTLGANGAHNQIPLTSGAKTLMMDDDLYYGYGGGATATPPAAGCYMVTGVMNYNNAGMMWTINPRTAADLVTTTGC